MFPLEIDVLDCLMIGVGGGITMIGCMMFWCCFGIPGSSCAGNGDLKLGSVFDPFVCVWTLGIAGALLWDGENRDSSDRGLASEIGSLRGNAIGPPAGAGIDGILETSGDCKA